MPKIFISYRREDAQWPVDRLRAALAPHVSNPSEDIFVDIDNIPVGADFVKHIEEQVSKCDVLLAVIGSRWLDIRDKAGGRRLEDPEDFVRVEIAAALRRSIPVAPVLIDEAQIPGADDLPEDLRGLARRNGVKLRRDTFSSDAQRLISGLKLPPVKRKKKAPWVILGATAAVVGAGVALAYLVLPMIAKWRAAIAGTETGPVSTEPAPATASLPPNASTNIVFDFDRLDTARPPLFEIAAAPFLHDAPIPIDVDTFRPGNSRIVIRNNQGFYDGRALKPTVSQNFLTQAGIGQADCSFTLRFGKPVAAVTFRIPAIFPASSNGVSFPAWKATALAADGSELASVSAALARRFPDMPDGEAVDYTLRTPNLEPIAFLRFDSDFRRDGKPFAGFEAVVIERIELEPM